MDSAELDMNKRIFASENNVDVERVRVIPKSELVKDCEYQGNCRNSDVAVWNGSKFVYSRYKFGSWYDEEINHFEDDDGSDVFVPMEIKLKSEENHE